MMAQRWIMKLLKLVFIISTASFLIVQIQLRRRDVNNSPGDSVAINAAINNAPGQQLMPMPGSDRGDKFPDDFQSRPTIASNGLLKNFQFNLTSGGLTSLDNYRLRSNNPADINNQRPSLANLSSEYRHLNLPNFEDIRKSIEDNNANAIVHNEDEFGPVEDVSYVVVVQVHNRSKYLDKLIQSLHKAKYIDQTLLVFSHDYYSSEINSLVKAIKFCRVMQIFYPYSLQIYPDRFPGQDPRDCAADVGKEKAKEIKCQNWEHPDKYGHFRVAKYSQVKHHWWWKMNYVFDGVVRLKNYTGWVLLLEEDHYVSPDFLHVFEIMIRDKDSLCAECSIITLGFYLKSYTSYASSMNKNFCNFDDYNWDWSLMHINLKCLSSPMTVIYAKSPRVFHIGDCGIHHTGKQCTADSSATKFISILEGAKSQLFPNKLEVSERSRRTLKAPKENGGWGDIRDHELCLNNTLHLR